MTVQVVRRRTSGRRTEPRPDRKQRRHLRMRRGLGRSLTYLFFIVVAVITLVPLLYGFFSSLKPLPEIVSFAGRLLPQEWTWSNYAEAWTRGNFSTYFLNSVIVTGGVIIIDSIASSMCAYVLARKRLRGQRILEVMFMITLFIGLTTAVLYPQFLIARALGIANLTGVILVIFAGLMIIHILLMRAFLQTLGTELEEAARLDGCGFFGIWWRIALPLMMPILATTIILGFQASWNNFQVPLVFTLTEPQMRTVVIGVAALRYDATEGVAAYDIMLAGASIAIIPVIIAFLFLQRYFVRGWTEGSVKG